jgi:hypothetical protein
MTRQTVSAESTMNSATSSAADLVTTNTFQQPAGAVASSVTLASGLASCRSHDQDNPRGFARLGNGAGCDRTHLGIGTDTWPPDMLLNLQLGLMLCRVVEGDPAAVCAEDLFDATMVGGPTRWAILTWAACNKAPVGVQPSSHTVSRNCVPKYAGDGIAPIARLAEHGAKGPSQHLQIFKLTTHVSPG